MRTLFVAGLTLCVATSVSAADITRSSDGYTYFNRPGGDFAAHDADIVACRKIAGELHQPLPQTTVVVAGAYGALGAAIGMAIAAEIRDVRAHPSNVENCMVARGWRVVTVDKAEGESLKALDKKKRIAAMAAWIGADTPHGRISRTFANELALDPTGAVFTEAVNYGHTALSADLTADPVTKTSQVDAPSPPSMPKTARPPKPVKAQDLGGVPADEAIVVVSIGGSGAMGLDFERVGAAPDKPAWTDDGKPSSFRLAQSAEAVANAHGGAQGAVLAFVVPAGRWRLVDEFNDRMSVSFCLGSPAFDVAPGEVIYAGTYDPDHMGAPDLSLDGIRPIFPPLSGLGDKLRAASYVNGAVGGGCRGAYAYALEIPGAPFAPGYAWGSRGIAPGEATAVPPPAPAPPVGPPIGGAAPIEVAGPSIVPVQAIASPGAATPTAAAAADPPAAPASAPAAGH